MAAGGLLLLSVLALTASEALQAPVLFLWAVFGVVALLDLLRSFGTPIRLTTDLPTDLPVGADVDLMLEAEGIFPGTEGRIDWPEGVSGPERFFFDGPETAVPLKTQRRGIWDLGRLWLRWRSPWGLFERMARPQLGVSAHVVPDVRKARSGEIETVVKSALFGAKVNSLVGEGSEFHQLQEFVPGMDTRAIDWHQSARHNALIVKDHQAERNHHLILALDNGYLMREEVEGMPKIDHAITAALALAWAGAVAGDLVGLYAYDGQPRMFIPPRSGRAAFSQIRSHLAGLDYATVESNPTLAFSRLNSQTPRRSLIVVFSDFVDTTTAELMVENVAVLARRHAMVFVSLRDPALSERVSTPAKSTSDMAKLVSARMVQAERDKVLRRLSHLGVTVLDVAPDQLTPKLVGTYLDLKAREVV